MGNEVTTEYLENYLNTKGKAEFAVALVAPWGAGKTHFIKKFIENKSKDGTKFLYLSLNGLTSIEEIDNQIYKILNPKLSGEFVEIISSISKILFKALFRLEIDSKTSEKIKKAVTKPQNYNFIFDDIERCELSIGSLFGYITKLLDAQNTKTLLILNEDKVKDQDTYREIKEKLVGLTLSITPETKDAITEFFLSTELKDHANLSSLIETALNIINESSYKNLRNIKQALTGFNLIFGQMPKIITENKGLLTQLLGVHLIFSIETKSGKLLPTDIKNFSQTLASYAVSTTSREVASEKPTSRILLEKYSSISLRNRVVDDEIWHKIIYEGCVELDLLGAEILKSHYFSPQLPDWQSLWNMYELTDEEFNSNYASARQNFDRGEIENLEVLLHHTGIFLRLSEEKIILDTEEALIAKSKKLIKELKEKQKLPDINKNYTQTPVSKRNIGMSFLSLKNPLFIDLLSYAEIMIERQYNESLSQKALDLVETLKERPSSFIKEISVVDGEFGEYCYTPIMNHIPINDFIECTLSKPTWTFEIGGAIKKRYENHHSGRYLNLEIIWLGALKSALNSQKNLIERTISKSRISSFVLYFIDPSIENLVAMQE